MDFHRINFVNCIKINKTEMTMNYRDNFNNETIVLLPAKLFPFVRYEEEEFFNISTPWFTLCGPIVLLLRELAKLRHAWLIIWVL